jgi:hypothetical protein
VLYCNIMTRVPTDKDQDLLEKVGGSGFPHLVFMDGDGKVIAEHEGGRDAASFAESGKKAQSFLDLRKKAEKGDKAARFEFFLKQLELGQLALDEAEKKLKEFGTLSKDQKAKADPLMTATAVRDALRSIKENDPASEVAAGKKLADLKKAGKPPPKEDELYGGYWAAILAHAEAEKNAALYEEALTALKQRFSANPRLKPFFDEKDAVLRKLKEAPRK